MQLHCMQTCIMGTKEGEYTMGTKLRTYKKVFVLTGRVVRMNICVVVTKKMQSITLGDTGADILDAYLQ